MGALATLREVDIQDAGPSDSVAGVAPSLVARPRDLEQVRTILRAADEDGLALVPRGSGSKLGWAPPPRQCDLLLDLSAMRDVLDHQAGDLIVAAEAGTPVAALQQTVAGAGQRLALDEVVPGTSIGGLIATNISGPRRMAYGTVRDLLIGVTIVRADGTIAKSGGKVVKNVAGYDLGKLMTGSYGTLAVITSAYFRLHPVPEASTWITIERESPTAAGDLIAGVVHSQIAPAAVEIDAASGPPTTVAVLLEGTAVGVDGRLGRVVEAWGADARVEEGERDLGFPGQSSEPLLKLTCQISSAVELAQVAVDLGLLVRGSVGTGVLYAAAPEGTDLPAVLRRLRTLTAAAGGAAVVLRGAPAQIDAWGPVNGLDLMRSVKDRFDPEHRLSPGRFVGAI